MTSFREAFALSKEQVAAETPPGTVDLLEYHLERTRSGRNVDEASIQLIPRPSADPADPLNWPMWRKIACTIAVCVYSFVSNYTSSSIASALPYLASPALFRTPVPFNKLTQLVAVRILKIISLAWAD